MKDGILGSLCAATLGVAIAFPIPAMAFHGGGGGFGGMHGGFGGGAMHFGGAGSGGFHGGMVTGRSAFAPGAGRFAGAPFASRRVGVGGFHHFAFRNHVIFARRHFRNFAVFGAPFTVGWGWPYGYGGCWRQVWSSVGWRWIDVCDGYDGGY